MNGDETGLKLPQTFGGARSYIGPFGAIAGHDAVVWKHLNKCIKYKVDTWSSAS